MKTGNTERAEDTCFSLLVLSLLPLLAPVKCLSDSSNAHPNRCGVSSDSNKGKGIQQEQAEGAEELQEANDATHDTSILPLLVFLSASSACTC